MPTGAALSEYEVLEGFRVHLYMDDISDMYPSLDASREQAPTNSLAVYCVASDFEGTSAFHALWRREGVYPTGRVVACLNGVPMGASNAVDWATRSHLAVRSAGTGACPPEARVENRRPFPDTTRTLYAEATVVDDALGLAQRPRGDRTRTHVADRSFESAAASCAAAGFQQHPSKRLRNVTHGLGLGMEVQGLDNVLGYELFRSAWRKRALLREVSSVASRRPGYTPCLFDLCSSQCAMPFSMSNPPLFG